MSDLCKTVTLIGAHVQENGIIRRSDGWVIGRLDGFTFAEIEEFENDKSQPNKMKYVPGTTKAWLVEMDGTRMWQDNIISVADGLLADTEDTPGLVPLDLPEKLAAMTDGDTFEIGPFTVTCRMVDKTWLDSLPEFDGW